MWRSIQEKPYNGYHTIQILRKENFMRDFIVAYLKEHEDYFKEVSAYIFNHPETRFEEYDSAAYLAAECEKQGFTVKRNVADIETAFTASFGSGAPEIDPKSVV